MRRRQALAALIVSTALALSACGSDDDGGDGDTASTDLGVEVSGAPGEKPTLTIPDEDPPEDLQIEVLDEGDGAEVGENDVVVANYLGQTWVPRPPASELPPEDPAATEPPAEDPAATEPPADAPAETTPPAEGDVGGVTTEDTASADPSADSGEAEPYVFDNSYDRGSAASFSLNQVIPGWKDGLAGQRVGSRVLLSIPPDQGYGTQEGHDLQNDTLVFVVEIVDSVDPTASASGEPVADLPAGLPVVTDGEEGAAPTLDFAAATPPEASDSTLVVTGDGEELGPNLVVNMVQASYPDGADVITTWDEGQAPLTLAAEQLAGIPGLAEALTGASVGSRVVSRISAVDNANPDGTEGLPLVLVIDVIGSY
ncbi:FKBP-type peptidyl-prolyl cis-trans isomerase [Jiangella alkaliphila]|uniref:peptidylprolyl isomerase n=1 Tax=Jiangella alkaliphila TaxID=419479 RepID=A0A1H2KT99_9ACTN|nr:FKBP-type peptidyl-prolyl cis-trans isomerase [Jiangella alkaliphila]SDU71930.1 peptidylprolyl isomerase [Jiangella alkaliphila]